MIVRQDAYEYGVEGAATDYIMQTATDTVVEH
jgi:hypothetical protein